MRNASIVIVLGLLLGPATARADKDFAEPSDGSTWDCATDATVNINYSTAEFTLTGACTEVNLNGSALKVTAGDIDTLNINGAKNVVKTNVLGAANINGTSNKVTYKKAKIGKKPKVASVGKGNGVTKVK